MVVGFSREAWVGIPLPFRLTFLPPFTCDLLVSPFVVVPLPKTGGTATLNIDLPNDPSLVALQFFVQSLATVLPTGISTSGLGEAVIGS